MRRCTLQDVDFVAGILGHPEVFPFISEDGSDSADVTQHANALLATPVIYVMSPNEWTLAIFVPRSSVCLELHTCILPDGRGKIALQVNRDVGAWIFENTTCQKVITWVPVFNRAADLMARRLGFELQGNNDKSFLRHGTLYDQLLYGVTKEKWLCRQYL